MADQSPKKRIAIFGSTGSIGTQALEVIRANPDLFEVEILTAQTNDVGWHTVFASWLKTSHLGADDMVVALSVGGGTSTTSANLIPALDYALVRGAWIAGIVGRDKGYIQRVANAYVVVPTVNEEHVTPHAESFQSVLCHLLVWHPALQ